MPPSVALLAGAWIETCHNRIMPFPCARSLSSRERGSKLVIQYAVPARYPVALLAGAWIETGAMALNIRGLQVALLAGAWIETPVDRKHTGWREGRSPRGSVDRNHAPETKLFHRLCRSPRGSVDRNSNISLDDLREEGVALLAGAWIETTSTRRKRCASSVALLAGAWIEHSGSGYRPQPLRRSPRESVDRNSFGKLAGFILCQVALLAGGVDRNIVGRVLRRFGIVALLAGGGVDRNGHQWQAPAENLRRSPRGGLDRNFASVEQAVAPHLSLSSWERGSKLCRGALAMALNPSLSRGSADRNTLSSGGPVTQCPGCSLASVDRNWTKIAQSLSVKLSLSSRCVDRNNAACVYQDKHIGRSLGGSVDRNIMSMNDRPQFAGRSLQACSTKRRYARATLSHAYP